MEYRLTCDQVTALLTFYAEEKLSTKLSQFVEAHLQNCPECMDKYIKLKNIINKYTPIQSEEIENQYTTKQYKDFKKNLSAYIDNELNNIDSIKIKKIAISNPLARQDLENIYTFKKLLHTSFDRTKNELKNDFSKNILYQLHYETDENKKLDPFIKLTAGFFVMLTLIVACLIRILYF